MLTVKYRHNIPFKAVAIGVVSLFLISDLSWAVQPHSLDAKQSPSALAAESGLRSPATGNRSDLQNRFAAVYSAESLDAREAKIADRLRILNDARVEPSARERKNILYLLPGVILLLRKYPDTPIAELGSSVIERYFGEGLSRAISNLIQIPPLSEKMFYDENAIYENEKRVLEEYVKNGLYGNDEQWIVPLLYLATLEEDIKLSRAVCLLFKKAVREPANVEIRSKIATNILGQQVGFIPGHNEVITRIVESMDLMEMPPEGSIWEDFGGYPGARSNILTASGLYPAEIEHALNHALRIASLAKLTIEIFMQNEGARILSWEEVGDFIVAADCHDLGKGAKFSHARASSADLARGFDIAIGDIFAKVYLMNGRLKISLPNGKEIPVSVEGVNGSSWSGRRIKVDGVHVNVDIMKDSSGCYLFRTPIRMIELINAPRRLTKDEQRLVNLIHPVESVRILEEAGLTVPDPVRLAILYHHNLKGIGEIEDVALRARANKIANLLSLFDILDASQDYSRPYKMGLLSEDVAALCGALSGRIDKSCAEWFAGLLTQGSIHKQYILDVFAQTKPFRMLYHASSFRQLLRPFAMEPFRNIMLRLRLREGEFEIVFDRIAGVIANILLDPKEAADSTMRIVKDEEFITVSNRLLSTGRSVQLIITAINSVLEQSDSILRPEALENYLSLVDEDLSREIISGLEERIHGTIMSNFIHKENLEPAYKPDISDKTILCHIIADSILPDAQVKDGILNRLEEKMQDAKYAEKVVALSVSDPNDAKEFMLALERIKAQEEAKYPGYKVEFDVACHSKDLVDNIQAMGMQALAFTKEREGGIIQVEGIMLALRALRTGSIDNLLRVYKLLTGTGLTAGTTDIKELARNILFILPVRRVPIDTIRALNEIEEEKIKTAA